MGIYQRKSETVTTKDILSTGRQVIYTTFLFCIDQVLQKDQNTLSSGLQSCQVIKKTGREKPVRTGRGDRI
jgi:hypothetical protein